MGLSDDSLKKYLRMTSIPVMFVLSQKVPENSFI